MTDPVFQKLKSMQPELRERFGVRRMRVFGSFARKEQRPDSDVDLLLDFDGHPTLFDLSDIRQQLEDALKRSVDIVTTGGLHPHLKDRILKEAADV
jgi:predicted nucleotidyltransferase